MTPGSKAASPPRTRSLPLPCESAEACHGPAQPPPGRRTGGTRHLRRSRQPRPQAQKAEGSTKTQEAAKTQEEAKHQQQAGGRDDEDARQHPRWRSASLPRRGGALAHGGEAAPAPAWTLSLTPMPANFAPGGSGRIPGGRHQRRRRTDHRRDDDRNQPARRPTPIPGRSFVRSMRPASAPPSPAPSGPQAVSCKTTETRRPRALAAPAGQRRGPAPRP